MTILSCRGIFLVLLGARSGTAFSWLSDRLARSKSRPKSFTIFTTKQHLEDRTDFSTPKQNLPAISESLLLGSSLIYTYAALRKETLAYINKNGKDSLKEPALILTQDGTQPHPTDYHRYLKYPVTIPALQRFVELNRGFVTGLEDGKLWSAVKDEELKKLAKINVQLAEFDDQFSSKELAYGIVVDRTFKRITVVFRGSVTEQDWKHNLQAFVKCKIAPSDKLKHLGFKGEDIYAHRGFCGYLGVKNDRRSGVIENIGAFLESDESKKALKWEEIIENVIGLYKDKELSKFSLYITGHSLGGALAQLFAFGISAWSTLDDYPAAFPVTAITFASPTAGDEGTYQQAYNLLEKSGRLRHIRYSNQGDIVPVSPPQFMGYTQTGVNIHLSENDPPASVGYRNLKSLFSQRSLNPLSHHDLDQYLERMVKNDGLFKSMTVKDMYRDFWKDGDF